MGAKYVLMFEDEIFLGSINKAKWNIYSTALQDLTFYTISFLKNIRNQHDTEKANEIYFQILDNELQKIEPKLTEEVLEIFNLKNSVNSKKSFGGTSFENIKKMITKYKKLK